MMRSVIVIINKRIRMKKALRGDANTMRWL